MKKILILAVGIFFILLDFPLWSAEVYNVQARQEDQKIIFVYDLLGDGESELITVKFTLDGKTYSSDTLSHLSGDFGPAVKTGKGKNIHWDLLKDIPEGFRGQVDWQIAAVRPLVSTPAAPSPLNTQPSAPLPLNTQVAKGRMRLAILPWNLQGEANSNIGLIISKAMESIQSSERFDVVYSFYETPNQKTVLLENIWRRPSLFSSVEPDIESVCESGKKLGADVVLLLNIRGYLQGVENGVDYIKIYFVDTKNRNVVNYVSQENISIYMGDFNFKFPSIMDRAINKFAVAN